MSILEADNVLPVTKERLTDLSCNKDLVRAAEKIIESGSCAVSKPIRAGMTTSTVIACERRGRTLLALAPTRRILQTLQGHRAMRCGFQGTANAL